MFLFVGLLGPNGPCVFEAFVTADSVFVGVFWGRVETHIALVEFGWFLPLGADGLLVPRTFWAMHVLVFCYFLSLIRFA